MTGRVRLSEPQRILLDKLRRGAQLRHEVAERGLYRLSERGTVRTVQPATVDSLLRNGLLSSDLAGRVTLAASYEAQ